MLFARFEAKLKRSGFFLGGEGSWPKPDWKTFGTTRAGDIEAAVDGLPLDVLLIDPPLKERIQLGVVSFADVPLKGARGVQVLESAYRVRNNLFHGAKEGPERYYGHDQAVVDASIAAMEEILTLV